MSFMKILYVASAQDLSTYHGGTVHMLAVVKELADHGHEIHLAIQESAEETVEIPAPVMLHPLKKRSPYLLWKAGPEIENLLDEIQPDLVMERYYNFAGEGIIRAANRSIPTILEVNSPMVEYPGSTKSKADVLLLGSLKRRREKIGKAANLIITPIESIIPEAFREKVKEIE